MTKDRDELYGLNIRGTERPMPFVNPYRTNGELNEIEQWKLERHPLEIADAIIDTYSKEGPAGIAKVPGEVERLKWAGIYPQKQGGDAFMMRVKVPGGFLTAPQIREIGVVADAFGEGPDGTESRVFGSRYADLTTRQTVQIHWLRIEDIPRIWRRFAAVGPDHGAGVRGLGPQRAVLPGVGGRRPRGLRRPAHRPGRLGLLHRQPRVRQPAPQVQDVGDRLRGGLRPGRDQRHRPVAGPGRPTAPWGSTCWSAAGCPTASGWPRTSTCSSRQDQAVEVTRAIAQLFGELGNRENRGLARMRYLVQELGPEGFRDELAARARFDLVPAGEDLTRRYRGDHVGVHPRRRPGSSTWAARCRSAG